MLSRSLREQIKCRWREFLREPSAAVWVVTMPLLWMIVLGFAFSEPRAETYGVAILTDAPVQSQVLAPLRQNPQIKLREGPAVDANIWFQRGEVVLTLGASVDGTLTYGLDPANPESARARVFVDQLIQVGGGRQNPVLTIDQPRTARGSRYVDFLVPGLLGLSVMTTSLFGVAMTIVSNRRENLLKRYVATPMPPSDYIISHIVGRFIILAIEFAVIMLAAWMIFDFHVAGSWFGFISITLLGAAAFTAMALLCAARSKSLPFISGLTNLLSLPMVMVSGVFFSKNNYPESAQWAIDLLPLTAMIEALRRIALEGQDFMGIAPEAGLLTVYLVVCTILSRLRFRWY